MDSSTGSMGTARSGKVDTGAAQRRLAIDGAAGPHVMADVRNMDVQRVIAVRQLVHPHGVVEIARGFAVDGDDRACRGNRGARPTPPR